jgi:uncharacterized membrane protein SirB2
MRYTSADLYVILYIEPGLDELSVDIFSLRFVMQYTSADWQGRNYMVA